MIENRQGKLKMHSKIALYASKSRGNVAVVLKDSAIWKRVKKKEKKLQKFKPK